MPRLSHTVSIYPEDLLLACPANGAARQWLVLYTKPRQEHALARDLLRLRVPFYLPLVPRISLCGRRRIRSLTPLFNGYMFLFGDEAERVRCLTTHRVVRTIPVVNQESLSRDLRHLEQLIKTEMPLTVESQRSSREPARVRGQSPPGSQDTVAQPKGEAHIVVSLDLDRGGLSFQLTTEAPVLVSSAEFWGEGI